MDDHFQVETFSVKSGRFLCVSWGVQVAQGGVKLRPRKSKEVPGVLTKPRAPERWAESSGRGQDDDFLTEAFST